MLDRLAARLPVANSVELIDLSVPEAIEDTPPANNSFGDLWRPLATVTLNYHAER